MNNQRYQRRIRQLGQIYVEYIVCSLVMVMILFAPLAGEGSSVVALVLAAIRAFNMNSSLLLSLP